MTGVIVDFFGPNVPKAPDPEDIMFLAVVCASGRIITYVAKDVQTQEQVEHIQSAVALELDAITIGKG